MTVRRTISICIAAALLGALADVVSADERPGSVARQTLLKRRLQKAVNGTLAASLKTNREKWDNLKPEQKDKVRRDMYAFEQKTAEEQKKLLQRHEKLNNLSPEKQAAYRRRAKWLAVVIASFTPEQRDALKNLKPDQRAQRIIARRDKLIADGKIKREDVFPPAKAEAPAATTEPSTD